MVWFLGTDGCAHQESLKNNLPTLGILAHGLHMLYPYSHSQLAKEMLENNGALLSEFNSSHKTPTGSIFSKGTE